MAHNVIVSSSFSSVGWTDGAYRNWNNIGGIVTADGNYAYTTYSNGLGYSDIANVSILTNPIPGDAIALVDWSVTVRACQSDTASDNEYFECYVERVGVNASGWVVQNPLAITFTDYNFGSGSFGNGFTLAELQDTNKFKFYIRGRAGACAYCQLFVDDIKLNLTYTVADPVTVTLSNLTQTYDGSPKPVTVTTSPAGISTVTTYNGSSTVPSAVGTYSVVSTVNQYGYYGSGSGTLTITTIPDTINLSNLNFQYDGAQHSPTVTTSPAGLSYSITYNGSSTAPSGLGSYAILAVITQANHYPSSATGTMSISAIPDTINLTDLNFYYDGAQHSPTVTTSPAGLSYSITYNGDPTAPSSVGSYVVSATINQYGYVANNDTDTMIISWPTITGASKSILTNAIATGMNVGIDSLSQFNRTNGFSWMDSWVSSVSYSIGHQGLQYFADELQVYLASHYHGIYGVEKNTHGHPVGTTNWKGIDATGMQSYLYNTMINQLTNTYGFVTSGYGFVDEFCNALSTGIASSLIYYTRNNLKINDLGDAGSGEHFHGAYADRTAPHTSGRFEYTMSNADMATKIYNDTISALDSKWSISSSFAFWDEWLNKISTAIADQWIAHLEVFAALTDSGLHAWGNNTPHQHEKGTFIVNA